MKQAIVVNVPVEGHVYRVQVLGVATLKALGVLSDEDEALLHRAAHIALFGIEDESLTWSDVAKAMAANSRVAERCVLEDDVSRLPEQVVSTLAGVAMSSDFLGG